MSWGLLEGVHVGDERAVDDRRASAPTPSGSSALFAPLAAAGRSRRPVEPSRRRRASTGSASARGCASRARCPRCAAATSWRRCRSPATARSARSLLADLRKHATLGGDGFYDLEPSGRACASAEGRRRWRCGWPPSWARACGLGAVVSRVDVLGPGGSVTLADGEEIARRGGRLRDPRRAAARACEITGVSDARLRSLRAQRQALAAKVVVAYDESFWQRTARTGWPRPSGCSARPGRRAPGVLSLLVPPERLSAFLAAPGADARRAVIWTGSAALYGERAPAPDGDARARLGRRPVHRWATSRAGRPGT